MMMVGMVLVDTVLVDMILVGSVLMSIGKDLCLDVIRTRAAAAVVTIDIYDGANIVAVSGDGRRLCGRNHV